MPTVWKPKIEILKDKIAKEEENLSFAEYRASGKGSGQLHPPKEEPTKEPTYKYPFWQPTKPSEKISIDWAKGLEYAMYPFSLVGMSQPRMEKDIKPEDWRARPIGERLRAMLPGGEVYEEYRERPTWEQLLAEAPAWALTGKVPTAMALRAGLATKAGVAPKVIRAALAPIAAVEKAPVVAIKYGVAKPLSAGIKQIMKFKPPVQMTNKLPYLNPQLTPYMARKQTKLVIGELTEHLGVAPIKPIPVITKETMKLNLWNRIGEKYQGFINRTYRVENLLLRADKYVDGGKMHQTFWQPIEQATNQQISQLYKTTDNFKQLLLKNNINLGRMLNQTVEIDGIRLTPFERVGVYLHSQNADNLVHIVFGNNIPARTVTNIVNSLTPEEKLLADFFQTYYTKQTPEIALAMKQVTGKTMKTVENYFPLQTQRKAMEMLDFNQFVIDERKLKFASKWASSRIRKGFTLPRTGKAMQPVELDSLSVWMKNIEGVEHYKAFAPAVKDLQRIMADGQFRHSFINSQGKAVVEVMEQWLKDVAKTNPLGASNHFERMMRTFRVNAVTAVLGVNLTTAMKQFASYFAGMAEVGTVPALRGLFTFSKHPRETMALLKQYAPQIYKRKFEREIAEAALMRSMAGRVTGKLSPREVFMLMTTSMDRLAVNGIWRGAFDDALKKGMIAKEAAEYATRAIRRTQPYFGIKDVPEYWRAGELAKGLTMFTNQLNQYWNYYRFHIIGKRAAGRISNYEVAKRITETFLVPALIIGAITRSRPAEDLKEFVTDLSLMGLATVPIFGNWMAQGVKGFIGGGLITTEMLDEIRQMSYRINKGEWDKAALGLPQLGGYALGYPVAQPKRFLQGIWDIATDKTDDWMRLIWSEYTRGEAEGEPAGKGSGKLRPLK